MNTHVRDNLNALKSDPVIAETTSSANITNSNGGWQNALTLTSVAIPSDVGECYVEAWALGYGLTEVVYGHMNGAIQLYDSSAGSLQMYQFYGFQGGYFPGPPGLLPYYARSRDLAWAGTTRTVSIRTYASGFAVTLAAQRLTSPGGSADLGGSPIVLRIVRSY